MMPMSKTTLITSRDPKGTCLLDLVAAAINKAGLDDDGAQRVIENGGEFQAGVRKLLAGLSVSNRYAEEEVRSTWIYPPEYGGPAPIGEQVATIAALLSLPLEATMAFVERGLPKLTLPDLAEGWFAIPTVEAIAAKHFPNVKDPGERYCRALNLLIEKLAKTRALYNYREGELTPDRLTRTARTIEALTAITGEQKAAIVIIPAQFGLRHRGRSTRRSREVFRSDEFGLGGLEVGSMAATHSKRFVRWEQLHTDCPGDDFASEPGADPDSAPVWRFYDGRLEFSADGVDDANEYYGSASGFRVPVPSE